MTSTNSSSKFLNMLKNNFRRHYVLFIIFQIAAVLLSVFFISLSEDVKTHDIADGKFDVTYNAGVYILLFTLISIVYIFILVAVLFRGIYSKRASDLYFAIPVKRGSWFNANFLFGVISLVVSYIIISGSFIFAYKCVLKNGMNILNTGLFLKCVVKYFIAALVLYTVFVMCACIAGRMWQYILSSFIATAVLYLGTVAFICYLNTIYGMWVNLSKAFFVSAIGLIYDIPDKQLTQFFIAAAAQFIVFYLAGYFSFKARKAEVAENSLSGKILPFALTVICFLSEIFLCLSITETFAGAKLIAGVVAALVTAVILSVIFFRKVFSKKIGISLAAAVALSAVLVLSVQFVPEKMYVNYVPESSDVESVKVYSYGELGTQSIIDFLYGINYLSLNDDDEHTQTDIYEFKTDAGKEKVYAFHTQCLDEKTRRSANIPSYRIQDSSTWKFEYTLKNGRKVARTYMVSAVTIYEEFANLLQTDEGIGQIEDFSINPKDVICADLDFERMATVRYQGKSISSNPVFLDSEHIDGIFKCIKKDMQNVAPMNFAAYYGNFYIFGNYNMKVGNKFYVDFYMYSDEITEEEKAKLQGMTVQEMLDYNTHYINEIMNDHALLETYSYPIFYDDENTIAYLKELGYDFKQ